METPKTKECPKCPGEMIRHNAEYNCLCGYGEMIPETPMCSVADCGEDADCELAVEGDWLPVCSAHALNRIMPRRELQLSPANAEPSHR